MRGERRSTRKGASVEFADFRKYEAGDDFRHVDWNVYARLERLMLRQFVEEEDVRVDVLVDRSESMGFGSPVTKLALARKVAAVLAFLAVTSLDRVAVSTFDSTLRERGAARRGRGHLRAVLRFLEELETVTASAAAQASAAVGGAGRPALPLQIVAATDLAATLAAFRKAYQRPGIVFVISDFLDPTDFRREVRLLVQSGFDVNLVQILAPDERAPALRGDLTLVDSETGESREVTVNDRMLEAYQRVLHSLTGSQGNSASAMELGT
jgi:uncharacterized protein (DUF58 family)